MAQAISFIVGIIAGIFGGILAYNGWISDPKELGLIVIGAILIVIGIILSGWVIILGIDGDSF